MNDIFIQLVRRKLTLRKFPSPPVKYSLNFAPTKAFQMLLELLFIKKKLPAERANLVQYFPRNKRSRTV